MRPVLFSWSLAFTAACCLSAGGQAPARVSSPPPITLAQALVRARTESPDFEAEVAALGVAKAGVQTARAGLLPSLDFNGSYLYTQGNRYIANNAVHEYTSQGTVSESLNFGSGASLRRAQAAEALAAAQEQIEARGLDATVTADYYTLLAADHELTTAKQALTDAQKYLKISQDLEQGGEVAHADVIQAELEMENRQRSVREAQLAQQKSRLALAVLLFPDFNQNFTLADTLDQTRALPTFERVQALGHDHNPLIAAATAGAREAQQGVTMARAGLLPALTLNYTYGIDAAQFALRNELGLPNLGSSATASLLIPVFDWGGRRAQVQVAHLQSQKAAKQLSATRRLLEADLHGFYAEAAAADSELTTLAHSRQLAAESLRLTALRYKDGEATILELVTAEDNNAQARDAYDAGLLRSHVARAQLQTLTGPF